MTNAVSVLTQKTRTRSHTHHRHIITLTTLAVVSTRIGVCSTAVCNGEFPTTTTTLLTKTNRIQHTRSRHTFGTRKREKALRNTRNGTNHTHKALLEIIKETRSVKLMKVATKMKTHLCSLTHTASSSTRSHTLIGKSGSLATLTLLCPSTNYTPVGVSQTNRTSKIANHGNTQVGEETTPNHLLITLTLTAATKLG